MNEFYGNNISEYIDIQANLHPFSIAVCEPIKKNKNNEKRAYKHFTYLQLRDKCNKFANAMQRLGIKKGMKVLLMVKPSILFPSLTFALFKIGAVPILIDPGMGKQRLLECIKDIQPDAVVGLPLVHIIRIMFPKYFNSVQCNVVVGNSISLLGHNLFDIADKCSNEFKIVETKKSDPAAILFTSGSTGPAKGVLYEHGMFISQVRLLKNLYSFQFGEVDLACLPVFSLFDIALGMVCIIPDMDASKPAQVNPEYIIEAINDFGVTNSFGSPAIWKLVASYCLKNNIRLPSVKRILMAGAPVSGDLILKFKTILVTGDVYTPYGATESLPVASISGSEVINETYEKTKLGKGTCVGHRASEVEIKIIKISDEIIYEIEDAEILPKNEIGEIIVNGPTVTKQYFNKPDATKKSKINDNGKIWHRIGDTGYIDNENRLWFCGRKAHRVSTKNGLLFTIPIEAIYNKHPKVFRSALVGIGEKGNQTPVIIIEPKTGFFPDTDIKKIKFIEDLFEISKKFNHCSEIKHILFHESFPVDIRHNAKIFREKLSIWAKNILDVEKSGL